MLYWMQKFMKILLKFDKILQEKGKIRNFAASEPGSTAPALRGDVELT